MKRRDLSIGLIIGTATSACLERVSAEVKPSGSSSVQTPQEAAAGIVPVNTEILPFNVLRYGADPTGVRDSTDSLNQAFLANNEVYIPSGTYRISKSIVKELKGSFRVHGAGQGLTRIVQYADVDAIILSKTSTADVQINVESLTIMPAVPMKTAAALNFRDDGAVPAVTVRDVVIGAGNGAEFKYGIRTKNCTESRYDRVSVYGINSANLIGWDMTSTVASSVPKFFGCSVYNASVAVKITNTAVPGIEGVQFYGCDFVGVMTGLLYGNLVDKFAYFPPQILWIGGHINAGYRNIDITQATEITIVAALFYNYSAHGEFISLSTCSDINIQNNQFMQVSGASTGISYSSATVANGGVIANNHFSLSPGSAAIRLDAARVQNLTIKDNIRRGGSATVQVVGSLDKSVSIEGNSPLDADDISTQISVNNGVLSLLGVRSGFVIIGEPASAVSVIQLQSRFVGQTVSLQCHSPKVTLKHGGAATDNFLLKSAADFNFGTGGVITLFRGAGGSWIEVSRSA